MRRKLEPLEALWASIFLVGFVGMIALPQLSDKALLFGLLMFLIVLWFPITIFQDKKKVKAIES